MVDIKVIEERMIEELSNVAGLKYVDSFQGDISELTQALKLPAAYTIYRGAKIISEVGIGVKSKVQVDFSVFVIGKNLRGKKDTAYDVRGILKDVRDVLHGFRYERVVLLWQGERFETITQSGICVYSQDYQYTDYLIS